MGADFSQVFSQWVLLWVQVVVWGVLAYFCYNRTQCLSLSEKNT
jgi:hypothetical protein